MKKEKTFTETINDRHTLIEKIKSVCDGYSVAEIQTALKMTAERVAGEVIFTYQSEESDIIKLD